MASFTYSVAYIASGSSVGVLVEFNDSQYVIAVLYRHLISPGLVFVCIILYDYIWFRPHYTGKSAKCNITEHLLQTYLKLCLFPNSRSQ